MGGPFALQARVHTHHLVNSANHSHCRQQDAANADNGDDVTAAGRQKTAALNTQVHNAFTHQQSALSLSISRILCTNRYAIIIQTN
jgi:hypothetical protein